MAGDPKALRKIRLKLNAAARHLEDLMALVAAKMMVMFLARDLVPGRLSRQGDRGQPVLFQKIADVAINRRNADALYPFPGVVQRLFRRKRTIRAQERRPNRIFLPRPSRLNNQTHASSLKSAVLTKGHPCGDCKLLTADKSIH